jgi:hypothetical protein
MKTALGILAAVSLLVAVGCSGDNKRAVQPPIGPPDEVPEDLQITLTRDYCLGTCPVYSVSVDASGNVEYNGLANVSVVGQAQSTIPTADVELLFELFQQANYSAFDSHYWEEDCPLDYVTDQPGCTTSITADGDTKSVAHDLGCWNGGPELAPLCNLECEIDRILKTSLWTGHAEANWFWCTCN